MKEAPVILRERQLLNDLVQMSAERATQEQTIQAGFQSRKEAAEKQLDEAGKQIPARAQAEQQALGQEVEKARQNLALRFEAEWTAVQKGYSFARRKLAVDFEALQTATVADYQEGDWNERKAFEDKKAKGLRLHQEMAAKIEGHLETVATVRVGAGRLLKTKDRKATAARRKQPQRHKATLEEVYEDLEATVTHATRALKKAERSKLVKLRRGALLPILGIFMWLAFMAPAAVLQPQWYYFVGGGTAGAFLIWLILALMAKSKIYEIFPDLFQSLAEAEVLGQDCQERINASYEKKLAQLREQHDKDQRFVDERFQGTLSSQEQKHEQTLRHVAEMYHKKCAEVQDRRARGLAQVEEQYQRRLADSKQRCEAEARKARANGQRLLEENQARFQTELDGLARSWREGLGRIQNEVAAINGEINQVFPAWTAPFWNSWKPPTAVPPVMPIGSFTLPLAQIPNGIPQREDIKQGLPTEFALPALATFPERASMLFEFVKEQQAGRIQAEEALQALMFRMLTALPPGKVRFIILDPLGLGRSFGAFMHLADYEELLVSSRVWTESHDIEQKLADLTIHIENVIGKYLRDQFETIEEYNVHAGEVAEPFRVLVVANFPFNFNTEAARRLARIVAGGSRCGVHTLITVDTSQQLPLGFELADLEVHSLNYVWQEDHFVWKDADFGRFPFQLATPPAADSFTGVLKEVGQQAKLANRVEVPFEFIAPAPDRWWTSVSRAGVEVPLGRSGATKRQALQLGKGTSQHVLLAGKTGSGKSTLLHALITNLALHYSPEEVELYLVDFKEGVEFKAYATHELPHARLVAIESEREFGLSVLQRLEAELKKRGDMFRTLGVQDINAYRQAKGTGPLPRILLIVDEFQLFFVEEDKIAMEAALLLDRLVRQGRAFGIHILLGSQTLGGAYSLARSTIDQMTVRIALQCSETDAALILSEDNSAARLLTRPGEAIYNDANGLAEGNDFFQVVWLNDVQKENYLKKLQVMARERLPGPRPAQIVFEGNAPADPRKNDQLTALLTAPTWPGVPRHTFAWLGEAMAIKDPTAAEFRPQTGSNLLLIGQFEEPSLAILATSLIGLAAQHAFDPADPNSGARFFVLDGSPIDSPYAGFWSKVTEVVPHPVKVGSWRELPAILGELNAEMARRQSDLETTPPFIYLLIYGLQRFRDLRAQEDDFGFSRRGEDKPPSPAKLFGQLIREGPAAGIFTMIWCDGLNNVNRSLERQALREFEMRVLFQMSPADSSNLIDSPVANKLGRHHALFCSEDRGQPEKFRPYELPTAKWLEWVKQQFAKKATSLVGAVK